MIILNFRFRTKICKRFPIFVHLTKPMFTHCPFVSSVVLPNFCIEVPHHLSVSVSLFVCLSVSFFSLSNAIGAGGLKRVRPYVPIKTLETIYKSFIQPHFDYCDKVWSNLNVTQSLRLQKLQNRAARVILSANYDGRSADLLESLQWDNLSQRRDKHMALLMCKTLQNKTPNYLRNMFSHNPRGDK